MDICNDSIILKSFADLQLGRAQEVIDSLEEMFNPCRLAVHQDIAFEFVLYLIEAHNLRVHQW